MIRNRRVPKREHRRSLWLVAAPMLLIILLCLSACSDMVLNSDGSISYPGQTLQLNTVAGSPAESDPPTTEGGGTLTLRPGETQAPSMTLQPSTDPNQSLTIEFLSTGKSDCILIRMDGKCILVDTADRNDSDLIRSTLDGYGITHIDCLILTHYDNDHIGSAADVLEQYTVGEVYMPDYVRNSKLYRNTVAALTEAEGKGTTVHRLYAQDVELTIGTGSLWINATAMEGYEPGQVLGADEDNDQNEENNFSLITALRYGDITVLLCGDAEEKRMAEYLPLAQARGITSCTLLKIPHHGGSADTGLLSAVRAWRPRACVVCTDAEQNVSAAVITNMTHVGAGQYFTYKGTVCFTADGTISYK